jgi:hypothetical protein
MTYEITWSPSHTVKETWTTTVLGVKSLEEALNCVMGIDPLKVILRIERQWDYPPQPRRRP